ncbi:MAG TPA: hypothetical protein VNA57_00380 [Acidimicrobiales bacterium]|nr:hypothetical protein [Acidimicrobiales bacterium]
MPHIHKFVAAITIVSAPLAGASGAQAEAEQHCVVSVVGRGVDGRFVTSPEACYPTFSEAMASIGYDVVDGAPVPSGDQDMGAMSFVIGTHYDGASGTGSSLTVNGDDCTGGWLNLSSSWINRISSTRNGCPRVRHADGYNLTGTMEETYNFGGVSNLTFLNNAANSIQYLT